MINANYRNEIPIALPPTIQAIAQTFRQRQINPEKGHQVYANTLAVYAVHTYLQWFGLQSDLERSESWQSVDQTLMDTGSLLLPKIGTLECRPVLPGETTCHIPADAWCDSHRDRWANRIGYVAVLLNESMTSAKIVGFLPRVEEIEDIPLTDFRSDEDMLNYLSLIEQTDPVWLRQYSDAGQTWTTQWQTPSSKGIVASGWRSHPLTYADPQLTSEDPPLSEILLQVDTEPLSVSACRVTLLISSPDDKKLLPAQLRIKVLDEFGGIQANPKPKDKLITLKFLGNLKERFYIQLNLNNFQLIHGFVI